MRRFLPAAAFGVLVVVQGAFGEAATSTGVAAQARAEFPLLTMQAKSPGEAVFLARCQYCHLAMGPGTLTLARRLGDKNALLANRTDLEPDYVKQVVRHGLNSMPPINRVEVSDQELDAIAAYLGRKR